jgi:NAD+ synthase (glutamine-hydrolysing)
MRIAILQINPTVGDLSGNADLIKEGVRLTAGSNPDLIATPELSLLGYPPRDLLLQTDFIDDGWRTLGDLSRELKGSPPVLVGIGEPNTGSEGRPLFNSAVLLHNGRICQSYRKTLLPTYDVFDEDRYFEPGKGPQIFRSRNSILGISICEDIWNDRDYWKRRRYHGDPIEELVRHGAKYLINISASPFSVGKQRLREEMLSNIARKYRIPLCYINQVGGNDDLVFDGYSCAFNAEGSLLARGAAFEEDFFVVDLGADVVSSQIHFKERLSSEAEIWGALVLGTRDYLRKTGFNRVVIGLSGGIDSSLVAAIAVDAIGSEHVLGVLMPSPYSSQGSIEDSLLLSSNLQIKTIMLKIEDIMKAYETLLGDIFEGYTRDTTEENLQARIRGTLLMAISNKFGHLLLTTGNKSEISVGYCTLYGDMCGALGVIADVPKGMVYRLARWLNATQGNEVIPKEILEKPPSAELKPDQTDQDTLPPYDLLDAVLREYIEHHRSAKEIGLLGYNEDIIKYILHLLSAAEFKRKQAPPCIKVTDRAFGTGWRMPIAVKKWQ